MIELAASFMMGYALVIDGDTIDIYGTRIRLWGIDAAELNTPEGEAAKVFLQKQIVDHGEIVECHEAGPPSYGRMVAKCTILDKDLAVLMICGGHAKEWLKYSRGYYSKVVCEVKDDI